MQTSERERERGSERERERRGESENKSEKKWDIEKAHTHTTRERVRVRREMQARGKARQLQHGGHAPVNRRRSAWGRWYNVIHTSGTQFLDADGLPSVRKRTTFDEVERTPGQFEQRILSVIISIAFPVHVQPAS